MILQRRSTEEATLVRGDRGDPQTPGILKQRHRADSVHANRYT